MLPFRRLQYRPLHHHYLHFSVRGRTVMLLDHCYCISGQLGDLFRRPACSLAELDSCRPGRMEGSSRNPRLITVHLQFAVSCPPGIGYQVLALVLSPAIDQFSHKDHHIIRQRHFPDPVLLALQKRHLPLIKIDKCCNCGDIQEIRYDDTFLGWLCNACSSPKNEESPDIQN